MRSSKRRVSGNRLSYSLSRLAKVCDLSRSLIYEEIGAGRLVARKVGRRTIVRRADAARWLRSLPSAKTPLSTIGNLSQPETGS